MSEIEEDPWAAALAEQAEASEGSADEEDPWAAALNEQAESEAQAATPSAGMSSTYLEKKDKVDLDVVMDVPVTLALEIGRASVTIRNLLSYTQGSVIELERLAGEPLDVLVNGTLIAHGEVVVVNDKFGVRLTDVVSPIERIKKLR
ncbi:MAG: flagellar motor switch protein FliN [Thiotrichales bacterium 32-46-8]|nr:flagellar motor switch protein FliN [Gammaproteobacteria bacterium]OYX07404.1 MAG: flagellar motor switch protein FliN [Thiotrichales bacterium 32-46-8]OYY24320.1 MAG: flagellar motor switch protein FliN [Thiotrichales bacterium 35-46-9]OYZ08070.1 MAG: flagellar motor switch protein FliN [Thiotrichales bacterium 16-46-22]OZA16542.1 MAG: flagellar motor switch protein FliN [Thiotrichales bacterium 17-46-47]OZA73238.1 MAG: flagellar motor switch protein FliN [Thiotrichales bacterium 39-47-5]